MIQNKNKNKKQKSEKKLKIKIEELTNTLKEVTQEKDRISAILQSIGDGVFAIDEESKIFMFNKVAADISKFNSRDVIGKKYDKVLKFVFEKTGKVNDRFIKNAIKTGEFQKMSNHVVLVRKDGTELSVANSAAPFKDKNGKVVGCVIVFRDVCEERAIDKAKTEFVSLTSHQLRTPLSAINWYSEMLLNGDAGKLNLDQKKYINEVYKCNQRIVAIVDALLNVSRIELGAFVINPRAINIQRIADSAVHEMEQQISKKKIELTKNYDKNISKIRVDPKLMRMIFQNLISNAVKYTPNNGRVNLKIIRQKPDILIKISDTGFGIPKKQQSKIFTKLFRADNIKEGGAEGTGLGLYIVKSILDHCGGKIWFKSQENKGSIFYVTIPLSGRAKKEWAKIAT